MFSDFTVAYTQDNWVVSYMEGSDKTMGDEKLTFDFETKQLTEIFLEFYIHPPRMFPPGCSIGFPRIILELYHEDGTRKDFVDSVAEEGYT